MEFFSIRADPSHLVHAVAQLQPGVVAEHHLATVRRVTDLLRHQEARPREHAVLRQQVQPAAGTLLRSMSMSQI